MSISIFTPAHIKSKLSKLGGIHSLELLLADLGDELMKRGDTEIARNMADVAECIRNEGMKERGLTV